MRPDQAREDAEWARAEGLRCSHFAAQCGTLDDEGNADYTAASMRFARLAGYADATADKFGLPEFMFDPKAVSELETARFKALEYARLAEGVEKLASDLWHTASGFNTNAIDGEAKAYGMRGAAHKLTALLGEGETGKGGL